MSTTLRNAAFQKYIARINVDEAHSIYTAGQDLHGLKAFWPAWGQVADLRGLLNESIHWNFFSATFPLHILKMIELKVLRDDYIRIQITSNRPNTMCATHKIVNSIEDPRNYECFLSKPFLLEEQPHVLIFCDDKDLTSKVSCHLNSCLPPDQRDEGIVMHYHSSMSEKYLKEAHDAFISETGNCRILVTTSGQSVVSFSFLSLFYFLHNTSIIQGVDVDFPNVKIVCNAGLPATIEDPCKVDSLYKEWSPVYYAWAYICDTEFEFDNR